MIAHAQKDKKKKGNESHNTGLKEILKMQRTLWNKFEVSSVAFLKLSLTLHR